MTEKGWRIFAAFYGGPLDGYIEQLEADDLGYTTVEPYVARATATDGSRQVRVVAVYALRTNDDGKATYTSQGEVRMFAYDLDPQMTRRFIDIENTFSDPDWLLDEEDDDE